MSHHVSKVHQRRSKRDVLEECGIVNGHRLQLSLQYAGWLLCFAGENTWESVSHILRYKIYWIDPYQWREIMKRNIDGWGMKTMVCSFIGYRWSFTYGWQGEKRPRFTICTGKFGERVWNTSIWAPVGRKNIRAKIHSVIVPSSYLRWPAETGGTVQPNHALRTLMC